MGGDGVSGQVLTYIRNCNRFCPLPNLDSSRARWRTWRERKLLIAATLALLLRSRIVIFLSRVRAHACDSLSLSLRSHACTGLACKRIVLSANKWSVKTWKISLQVFRHQLRSKGFDCVFVRESCQKSTLYCQNFAKYTFFFIRTQFIRTRGWFFAQNLRTH